MAYRKLGRTSSHRNALFRNLVTSLLLSERIETTEMKAKEISGIADKLITLARKGDLHARRQVLEYVFDEAAAKKLFDTIAPRYTAKAGGYTRVLKTGFRQGDAAPMAIIELI
ncbi:MAG: 50S ribosomal protein L17 [bacterium]|jgi:large subunit ribosomal protein L17